MAYITEYISAFFSLLLEMSPYLLLGFLFAGLLHVYFPKDKLAKYLGKDNFSSVINAALLGIPLPLCSCGVIPTGVSFYKNGASRGASVAFLISTPQTGVDSIFATSALMGFPFAITRVFIALITGIFGGILTNIFAHGHMPTKKKNVATNQNCVHEHTPRKTSRSSIKRVLDYAFVDFLQDISQWLIIGLGIAALIAVAIPITFFENYIGNNFVGMFLLLLLSIPLYVCATGSIPIAAVLLMKGISPGAAFVFLMAGPATNVGTITVLGKTLGKKNLIIYLMSIIVGALVFGIAIDIFLPASWFVLPLTAEHNSHLHTLPKWLEISAGILLTALIIRAEVTKRNWLLHKKPAKAVQMQNTFVNTISSMNRNSVVKVNGMTCNHCKFSVEKNITALEGVESVAVDLQMGQAVIAGENVNLIEVEETIKAIGFEYGGVAK